MNKKLEDTGERMIPEYHKSHLLYGEHIVRYQAAQSLAEGKVVLDLASGAGYGTKMLAVTAKKVYGVDNNREAIEYAKKNYSTKNIEFLVGEATNIPLDDNSIDLIVSFETLEHIKDYKKFLAQVKRVLKKDGVFIVSTPNDKEFPEDNEFHEHEFTYSELKRLLDSYFAHRQFYFQSSWLYSGLFDEDNLSSEWQQSVFTNQTAPEAPGSSIYFISVCSDLPIKRRVQPLAAIAEPWSERRRRGYEQTAEKHMKEQAAVIKHLDNENKHKHEVIEVLEKQLKTIQSELDKAHNSLFGKAYRTGRIVKRKINGKKNT